MLIYLLEVSGESCDLRVPDFSIGIVGHLERVRFNCFKRFCHVTKVQGKLAGDVDGLGGLLSFDRNFERLMAS